MTIKKGEHDLVNLLRLKDNLDKTFHYILDSLPHDARKNLKSIKLSLMENDLEDTTTKLVQTMYVVEQAISKVEASKGTIPMKKITPLELLSLRLRIKQELEDARKKMVAEYERPESVNISRIEAVGKILIVRLKQTIKLIVDSLPDDSRHSTEAFEQSLEKNDLVHIYQDLIGTIDYIEKSILMCRDILK